MVVSVIPAQAGIQHFQGFLDARFRGHDGQRHFLEGSESRNPVVPTIVIPAKGAFQKDCLLEKSSFPRTPDQGPGQARETVVPTIVIPAKAGIQWLNYGCRIIPG
jgi:hypothetical protein